MKTDWYTRSLLTVIAASLALIAAQPLFTPIVAKASGGLDDMEGIRRELEKVARSIDRMESYGIKVKEMPRTEPTGEPIAVPVRVEQ